MITYIEYQAATDKGQTNNGDVFNSPFALGTFDAETGERKPVDANYTGARVVENLDAEATENVLAWTPVIPKQFINPEDKKRYDAKVQNGTTATYVFVNPADNMLYTDAEFTTEYTVVEGDKVAYVYDNQIIPQNDLPRIKAEMKSIPLIAKARRIAINLYVA